jgi:hypothetical protein
MHKVAHFYCVDCAFYYTRTRDDCKKRAHVYDTLRVRKSQTFEPKRSILLRVDLVAEKQIVFTSIAWPLGEHRLHRHQLEYVVRPV